MPHTVVDWLETLICKTLYMFKSSAIKSYNVNILSSPLELIDCGQLVIHWAPSNRWLYNTFAYYVWSIYCTLSYMDCLNFIQTDLQLYTQHVTKDSWMWPRFYFNMEQWWTAWPRWDNSVHGQHGVTHNGLLSSEQCVAWFVHHHHCMGNYWMWST